MGKIDSFTLCDGSFVQSNESFTRASYDQHYYRCK